MQKIMGYNIIYLQFYAENFSLSSVVQTKSDSDTKYLFTIAK